jgi:2-polyprenyl-3-methyl-5-hydroxy-6-metoxy-1,4-benzoquinol methylase
MMQRVLEPELMDLVDEVDAYDRADFSDVNRRFVRRACELAVHARPAARAIDLGCGPGDITVRLAEAQPTWTVLGVDASMPMIDRARRNARSRMLGNLTFERADAKDMPGFGRFDVICANSLLHHLPEPLPFWDTIRKLAEPGAVVFIRDLARPDSPEAARAIVKANAGHESPLLQEEYYRSLLAAFTPAEVREQLARSGLLSLTVDMSSDRHLDVWGPL